MMAYHKWEKKNEVHYHTFTAKINENEKSAIRWIHIVDILHRSWFRVTYLTWEGCIENH